jgi:polyhydroxyalkanoate synthesis repressor PhaR
MLIKKYSNRRLYDTETSRYITLDELADRVRAGANVRVVDAQNDDDLTQATLAQVILESRHAAELLPVPLLVQLIRMRDDALAEFFGRYVSWALEVYLRARQGAEAMAQFNPLMNLALGPHGFLRNFSPFSGFGGAPDGLGRGQGFADWADPGAAPSAGSAAAGPAGVAPQHGGNEPAPSPVPQADHEDLAALRRELDELKAALHKPAKAKPSKAKVAKAKVAKPKAMPNAK